MPPAEPPRPRPVLTADSRGPRGEQQDAALALASAALGTSLLLVSDGVGGNSGGRMASQTVMELARKLWDERKGDLSDPYADLGLLCRVAHDKINEEGKKRGMSPRATVVALYLTPTQAHWVHSGDSRLYHFRKGQLVERTEDHSLLQVMLEQGMVREHEMGQHPDQGRLLQSLGGEEYKEPTRANAAIGPEDGFLLCTDGFWERTPVEEMAALLQTPASQAQNQLESAVETAVKRNGSGGDNVTIAVAMPADTPAETSTTAIPPLPSAAAQSPHHSRGPLLALIAVAALMLMGIIAAFIVWGFMAKPVTPPTTPSAELNPTGKPVTALPDAEPPSNSARKPPQQP
jgi:serine/threonine protein phosphatase PrpC